MSVISFEISTCNIKTKPKKKSLDTKLQQTMLTGLETAHFRPGIFIYVFHEALCIIKYKK